MTSTPVFPAAQVQDFVARLFEQQKVPPADAGRVAECLVQADLRGVSSHGVGRVPIYIDRLRRGLVNALPTMTVERPATVTARVDGDNALGFLVGTRSMQIAIDMAREHGMGFVLAYHSNHFGMAASYLKQATEAGLAAFVFTNASPAMPIWGGRAPFLGTSPFAFAAPAGSGRPAVMLDMAMSVVARGKVRRAMQRSEPIPLGWALDKDGRETTDAKAGYEGVVLPFGGVKGSGLSLMMEILAGVMSGANFGGDVRNQYLDFEHPQNVGHCFMAIRPDLFMPMQSYEHRMGELSSRAKATQRAEGFDEILLPGEPEERVEAQRGQDGIPLDAQELQQLVAEADRCGVEVPLAFRAPVSDGST
ncbi:Ldh family oxidoreductase [Methylobacterium sp. J-030]|uniref:Ldh family oxidoreductase n=1 Tax=Methylobacterium sp. J-030 TaxID=2836627 RepID=UPI001FB9B597|nr:Ldh family oxidoreductase [Methylobacterium sp. J-030]MCJ2074041.1 Ldh family oxidoreductase [Methylobacterium sp. J-030]